MGGLSEIGVVSNLTEGREKGRQYLANYSNTWLRIKKGG